MVRQGLLGTLTHAEGAYLHDLRDTLNEQDGHGNDISEAVWSRAWHTRRNGNLNPTHGLGPLCWYLGIHQGDQDDWIQGDGLGPYRAKYQVYDAAAWSSPFPLSMESVRTGGGAMAIPDFTSGHWN